MMDKSLELLLSTLSDGAYHSGEELGELLQVSRAAVWKKLQQLQDIGISISSVKGRGYCVEGGLDLLSQSGLVDGLGELDKGGLCLEVFPVIDSTNSYLMSRLSEGESVHRQVCTAEKQSAGKGRRGRKWESPFARNIYLSLGWKFDQGVAALEGLSLAVGVAIVNALEKNSVQGVTLKWPNDLLYEGRKLGGVLIEMAGDPSGECHVVIGIGLNVNMPGEQVEIDQPWVDLKTIANGNVSRSLLVKEMLVELFSLLQDFEEKQFKAYKQRWEELNAHAKKEVSLVSPSMAIRGTVLGVTDTGSIRLLVEGEERDFSGGEISLRGER